MSDFPYEAGDSAKLKAIEHQAVVKSSAETLHHETVFQFCDH
jgi:hypothetical protein